MKIQEVIIYGGCGQLGRAVLTLFKEHGYKTISIDRIANNDADQNIIGPVGFMIILLVSILVHGTAHNFFYNSLNPDKK